MKDYNLQDLKTDGFKPKTNDTFYEAVRYYAKTNLSNQYFLQHFLSNIEGEYNDKSLWVGFACVLIERGLPKINDVKSEILIWWQDPNWPGWKEIREFVINNKSNFLVEIKKVILRALQEKDVGWFKNLLEYCLLDIDCSLIGADKNIIEEMVKYLDNDEWKEFDKIYLHNVMQFTT